MREIRDGLSSKIEGMSFEEEKRFIRKHVLRRKGRQTKGPAFQPTAQKTRD
jgi:hypothetical protein